MNYFDTLLSTYFKTGKDSRKLFYPWGVMGRGYVITEEDEPRLRQRIKIYYIAAFVVTLAVYLLHGVVPAIAAGAVIVAAYAIYVPYMVRGLQRSDEKLRLSEAYTAQAQTFSPWMLWLMEALMVLLLAGSIAMFVSEPAQRYQALSGIVIFTCCAALFAWMLVLRRRTGPS